MIKKLSAGAVALVICVVPQISAQNLNNRNGIRRVLLISIDGMHALDYSELRERRLLPASSRRSATTGVNYTRTSTSRPSDSFPGLMALVTGGTPKTVGAFYDVAYDRVLAPPHNDTGNGVFSGACAPRYAERYHHRIRRRRRYQPDPVERRCGLQSLTDGDWTSIDPTRCRAIRFQPTPCAPVYPWNFIRTNTIYGVIHAAGGYTAWSDKHAVYAAVSGPTGTAVPSNVDDYYAPDVNSNVIGCPESPPPPGRPAPSHPKAEPGPTAFEHPVLRHAEGQRDPQSDRRQDPLGHATAPVPTSSA